MKEVQGMTIEVEALSKSKINRGSAVHGRQNPESDTESIVRTELKEKLRMVNRSRYVQYPASAPAVYGEKTCPHDFANKTWVFV